MATWEKNCPKCGGILDDKYSCTKCGYSIVTGISGTTYVISSAKLTSPSFYAFSDTFGDKVDVEKRKNELEENEYIDDEALSDYVKWGYLRKSSEEGYNLTELGKESVKKNRRKRGKVDTA